MTSNFVVELDFWDASAYACELVLQCKYTAVLDLVKLTCFE
jgi:hypothetical protein